MWEPQRTSSTVISSFQGGGGGKRSQWERQLGPVCSESRFVVGWAGGCIALCASLCLPWPWGSLGLVDGSRRPSRDSIWGLRSWGASCWALMLRPSAAESQRLQSGEPGADRGAETAWCYLCFLHCFMALSWCALCRTSVLYLAFSKG